MLANLITKHAAKPLRNPLSPKPLRVVKPEIRVLGIDDGQFVPHSKTQVLVVGVVFRAGYWLEGVMSTQITVDGFDATTKLANMIRASPHYKQLRHRGDLGRLLAEQTGVLCGDGGE